MMAERILPTKEVICSICGHRYLAKRQEADSRCSRCRKKYLQVWRNQPINKQKKAELNRLLRKRVFDGYGGKCACCGEERFEFLGIDHVNGGGGRDRKVHSTWQIAKRIISLGFPNEYRILCYNCNFSLGHYGYCPHDNGLKQTVIKRAMKAEEALLW